LANGTKPHSAKERIRKFEFVLLGRQWVMGEPQDLRAILNPLGIPMVPREHTAAEYLGDIVGFTAMHIPRLVTWRDVG
jgi:hypothetical protein